MSRRNICEVEQREGSFMTLGPRAMKKCDKPATVNVYEAGYKGGKLGWMPMCDEHYWAFKQLDNRPHTAKRRKQGVK